MADSAPGWYPDPDNSLQKRYWNGSQWTNNYQMAPDGADAWQSEEYSRSITANKSATSETRAQNPNPTSVNSVGKWVIGFIIFIVVIASFQSCSNRGWQMGVDGNGYQVTCQDGTTSMSGGIQGACSHHGGVQ